MKQILSLFLFATFIISCVKETCAGVEYINGISYKNGKPYTGKCITHHKNSVIRSIQNYKNGLDHGQWKFYHDNEKLHTIGSFNNGKKIGEWKYYHKNGKIFFNQFFDLQGNEIGTWEEFDEDGKLVKTYKKN